MNSFFARAAYLFAFGSAAATLLSVALCHSLLALSLACLLLSGLKLRFPPILAPLLVFASLTVLSMALSPDPAAGRPQIRKFYVFLILLVLYSLVRELRQARFLLLLAIAVASLSALKGMLQYYQKREAAILIGQHFYNYYLADRITGFMSHWMTFSGQMMIALFLVTAFLFFSARKAPRFWGAWMAAGALLFVSVVLGFTRSIWLATAAGGLYLMWFWRRWTILALPLLIGAGLWLGPGSLRARVISIWQPDQQLDSNQHRNVLRNTGLRMIAANPFFGVGPQRVEAEFLKHLPPDVPRPLPSNWWYGHLHNVYIHYAAERGLPAMLALVWLLVKILVDFARALSYLPRGPGIRRFILHGAIATLLGIAVGGWYELNLGDTEVLMLFLVVVVTGYVAVEAGELGESADA